MLSADRESHPLKAYSGSQVSGEFVGYGLAPAYATTGSEICERLQDKCKKSALKLSVTEWDKGCAQNPIRVGLWRALRRLVCKYCEPKRMSFNFMDYNDFLMQAFEPCRCGHGGGFDGIVVTSMLHLCEDQRKGAALVLNLTALGKHVVAEDGICLSCCHPAAQAMMRGSA